MLMLFIQSFIFYSRVYNHHVTLTCSETVNVDTDLLTRVTLTQVTALTNL